MVASTNPISNSNCGSARGFEGTTPARAQSPESAGEKNEVSIKLNQLPEDAQGHKCVILLKGLIIVDEFPPGKIIFDEVIYTWNIEPDDLRVLCWLDDSDNFREVGEAKTLQEALKLTFQDLAEWMYFFPKNHITVVE